MATVSARQSLRESLRRTLNFISKRLIQRTISAAATTMVLGITLGTSAPALATPPTVVGAIRGQFTVDANGAANYTIPLDLPAGPHGLTPKLALSYNSQSGPGLAGYGWTLSGLSAITRCGWTIAQDGQPQPITFIDGNGGDDYCLDGQKLRPDSVGSYSYRTEIDGFSNITAFTYNNNISPGLGRRPTNPNGPWWFQVQTKDGLTYQYGYTADSEIYAVGAGFSNSTGCTWVSPVVGRVWALSSITDRNGNFIKFTYNDDTATTCTGDYWISSITYGGSTGSTHTVNFTYDNMSAMWPIPADVKVSYRGGAAVGHTRRLNGINVLYNNNSIATLTYSLAYQLDPATSYSELKTVTECAVDGCYQPTQIAWPTVASQPGWTATTSSFQPVNSYGIALGQAQDAFGLGSQVTLFNDYTTTYLSTLQLNTAANDLIKRTSNVLGFISDGTSSYVTGLPMQFSGDGTTAFIESLKNPNGSATIHALGFTPSGNSSLSVRDYDSGINPNCSLFNFVPADINGDGFDDLIWTKTLSNGDAGLIVALNNGGTGLNGGQWLYDSGVSASNNPFWGCDPRSGVKTGVAVADFDGDGRADVLLNWGNSLSALTVTGTQAAPQLQTYTNINDVNMNYPVMTIDVNGDGLTDLLYVCKAGASDCTAGDWVLAVSTGVAGPNGFVIHDTGKGAASPSKTYVVDYEGDGRQDIMYPVSGEWYVMSAEYYPGSNGQPGYYGLSSPFDAHMTTSQIADPQDSGALIPASIGDFNGDGQIDFMTDPNGGPEVFALHNPTALHVSSIADGLNNTVTINYASISGKPSANIYMQGSYLAPNAVQFPGPLYVVSSYQATSDASNSDPATYTVSYAYQGAARDRQGRGFLGFRQITQTDSRIGETTITTYDQTFPYIGRIDEQKAQNSSGVLQLDTVNTPSWIMTSGVAAQHTDAYFPYVQTSTVKSWGSGSHDSLAGALVKTVKTTNSYNAWGNLVQATIDTNPGASGYFEENIISDYEQDNSSNWCLGLPLHVTVAKSYGYANTTQGTTPAPNNGGTYSNQARETEYTVDPYMCRVTSKKVDAYSSETGMSVIIQYSFGDSWGNVTEEKVFGGNTSGTPLRDTAYSYTGLAADSSAADGVHPTTVTYENATTGAAILQVQQTWDQTLGVMTKKLDQTNNLTTQWLYDGFGRKKQETEPDSTYTTYALSVCPSCLKGGVYMLDTTHFSSAGVAGAYSRAKYDGLGRAIETVNHVLGAGGVSQSVWQDTQYNALGLAVAASAPYQAGGNVYWTTTTYDDQNRPINITKPADQNTPTGTTTYVWYNQNYSGVAQYFATTQVTATTNYPDAHSTETTTRIADSQGNTVEVDDAAGGSTVYSVDAFGEVISIEDASQNWTYLDYDSLGHKIDMHDPDMGVWSYHYDALGELISQSDTNGNTISQVWDTLGRMTSRTEPVTSGSSTNTTFNWNYDTTPHCVGKLGNETNNNDFTKVLHCDVYGRPSGSDTTVSGTGYNVTLNYDTFGRVASMLYPSTPISSTTSAQLQVNYTYDANTELLQKVADSGTTYWQGQVMDQFGHYTGETYGNGVVATTYYDAATALVDEVVAATGSGTVSSGGSGISCTGFTLVAQCLQYIWDGYGNLSQRQSQVGSQLSESFQYDSLNRLLSSMVSGQAAVTQTYNPVGSIKVKSDVGTYNYVAPYAHRLGSITPTSGSAITYSYDNNGNLLSSSDGRGTIVWSAENLPQQIPAQGNCTSFSYDPDGQRYRYYSVNGGACSSSSGTTTIEIGSMFEAYMPSGSSPYYRVMIQAGGKTVAVRNITSNGTATVQYLHYDHLGSVDTISYSSSGTAQLWERQSFDAFGARRSPGAWTAFTGPITNKTDVTDRGYTGQLELDSLGGTRSLGLVDMNGRVYDPVIGRFISADPRIQDLYNGQDLHRYAYVNNNPLNSVDPTGFDSENVYQDSSGNFTFDPSGGSAFATISNGSIYLGSGSGAGNYASALPSGSNPTGNTDSTLFGQSGPYAPDDGDPSTTYGTDDLSRDGLWKEPTTAQVFGADGKKIGLYDKYANDPINQLIFAEGMDANSLSKHKEGSEYASYIYTTVDGKLEDTSLFSGTQNRVTADALTTQANLLLGSNPGATIVAAFHNHGTDYDCPGCYEGFSGYAQYKVNGSYMLDTGFLLGNQTIGHPIIGGLATPRGLLLRFDPVFDNQGQLTGATVIEIGRVTPSVSNLPY